MRSQLLVRPLYLAYRQFVVGGREIAHLTNARPFFAQRLQYSGLVVANGGDNAFTRDGDVHFFRFSFTYSAMVRTLLKMAFPSAGEANLMP